MDRRPRHAHHLCTQPAAGGRVSSLSMEGSMSVHWEGLCSFGCSASDVARGLLGSSTPNLERASVQRRLEHQVSLKRHSQFDREDCWIPLPGSSARGLVQGLGLFIHRFDGPVPGLKQPSANASRTPPCSSTGSIGHFLESILLWVIWRPLLPSSEPVPPIAIGTACHRSTAAQGLLTLL